MNIYNISVLSVVPKNRLITTHRDLDSNKFVDSYWIQQGNKALLFHNTARVKASVSEHQYKFWIINMWRQMSAAISESR